MHSICINTVETEVYWKKIKRRSQNLHVKTGSDIGSFDVMPCEYNWCVKGLELSGECGRVIYELGGMKPGPRSFDWCSLRASEEMVSNQTAFPSTIFMEREREKKEKTVLFWFGHA